MTFEFFIDDLMVCLRNKLGDGFDISYRKIMKNNSVEFDSIVIHEAGSNVSPSIYINKYYLEDISEIKVNDGIYEIIKNERFGNL